MLSAMMDQVKYVQESIDRLTSTTKPSISVDKTSGEETLTEAQEQVRTFCFSTDEAGFR